VKKKRRKTRWRQAVGRAADWALAMVVLALLRLLRLMPADAAIGAGAFVARTLGPWLPVHRVGRTNLHHAYPEKTPAEREKILRGVWDNLGRTAIEYLFLDRIFDFDPDNPGVGRIEAAGAEHFLEIRESNQPCIIFTAHLANWELLAVCADVFDLEITVLFRPPNNAYIADRLDRIRNQVMGKRVASRRGVLMMLGGVLERGGHVGMLVDQRFLAGERVPFFGREVTANPALAKLARSYNCKVYGARSIRLPDGRFRLELSDPIDLPRTATGDVDVAATMARVTAIVEGWVREHPEQWLWLHRRWDEYEHRHRPAKRRHMERMAKLQQKQKNKAP
jgi:Kdo2-lipid IVA lauroyltransferase/acyltransferase